jgi:cobalt-zinc-cadmium resistance protein CzcA
VFIPLSDVATARLISGPSFTYREGQERYIRIKFSVRDRDLGSAVLEAQQKVAQSVVLPGGYHPEWVGEFGNMEEALGRLEVVVQISIGVICLLYQPAERLTLDGFARPAPTVMAGLDPAIYRATAAA